MQSVQRCLDGQRTSGTFRYLLFPPEHRTDGLMVSDQTGPKVEFSDPFYVQAVDDVVQLCGIAHAGYNLPCNTGGMCLLPHLSRIGKITPSVLLCEAVDTRKVWKIPIRCIVTVQAETRVTDSAQSKHCILEPCLLCGQSCVRMLRIHWPPGGRAVGYVPSSLHPCAVAHAASSPKASRLMHRRRGAGTNQREVTHRCLCSLLGVLCCLNFALLLAFLLPPSLVSRPHGLLILQHRPPRTAPLIIHCHVPTAQRAVGRGNPMPVQKCLDIRRCHVISFRFALFSAIRVVLFTRLAGSSACWAWSTTLQYLEMAQVPYHWALARASRSSSR